MENQNRLQTRISRVFRSSFRSCKSRDLSDVIHQPASVPLNRNHYQLIELFSPQSKPKSKRHPLPSICRPKCSDIELFPVPRRKAQVRNAFLARAFADGWKCPPASPVTPLNTFYQKSEPKSKNKIKRKKTKRKTARRRAGSDNYYEYWFSSEEEDDDSGDEETIFFSSNSLSTDSSDSVRGSWRNRRRRSVSETTTGVNVMPLRRKEKHSFAVVKRSSDPQADFRTSMVEMIIERQIFGARELEQLLKTFLLLNSSHHHRVIVEVFTEIWEALFSDWP